MMSTLARFLHRGYFEKHINRMRKFYKSRRNRVISLLRGCAFSDRLTILEQDAGLHFILKIDTPLSDRALKDKLAAAGIRIRALSDYYTDPDGRDYHCLVVDYAGLDENALESALNGLQALL